MPDDYSEYQMSEYDKYRSQRSNRKTVKLDYFHNSVRFYPEDRFFRIYVDHSNEYFTMHHLIEQENAEWEARLGHPAKKESPEELAEYEETRIEDRAKNQVILAQMQSKYDIDTEFVQSKYDSFYARHADILSEPFVNVFSGASVDVGYGEGILDFIYADFMTPLQEQLALYQLFADVRKQVIVQEGEDAANKPKRDSKVYNKTQLIVNSFFNYTSTFTTVKEVAYASLYSAICPPNFETGFDVLKELRWYGSYLQALQKEYLELIEFCFDEDFYPGALKNLHPAERFALYRSYHQLPTFSKRTEEVSFSTTHMGGKAMPYGLPTAELIARITSHTEPNSDYEALAEKFGVPLEKLIMDIKAPHFMNIRYEFSSIADILELEFTKMLEANIRFRKCKRCGKYFIMKGNYDTNYCDRVAPGENRNCQELAAAENYKAKIADNKAIPIYNKYYKRYAARVKVRQIKEADFKKWKYQALTMRDECSDGKITVEEYIQWMEDFFPNRKPKSEK